MNTLESHIAPFYIERLGPYIFMLPQYLLLNQYAFAVQLQISESHGAVLTDYVLHRLHGPSDAFDELLLKTAINLRFFLKRQQYFRPFYGKPGADHFFLDFFDLIQQILLLDHRHAQPQLILMLICLDHHHPQLFIHLHSHMRNLRPLPQPLPSRTLMFQLSMRLVPYTIALVAKLTLANTFHMRTSYLFLYRLSALRTLSCMIFDPTGIDLG